MIENITVWELGEDSDTWFVEGTSDAHSADEAVRGWVEINTGQTIEAFTDADDLVEFNFKLRKDWHWLPGGDPKNPLVEAALLYPHDGLLVPDNVQLMGPFTGILVQS
ncbi:hypothetical protein [Glutamicibacter halophytocola]|uniref:Uncharacterized protein n=1 Tax=Glutamicibacter halophytocola TaxID=1933880 RepID=A0AA95BV72_9MICC|nr:hypothetical protein [Glutamicibacter halophytocola]UUX60148.1 hypothetical protein NUH22_05930 [Glutamicibacter halophytocola]